MGGWEAVILLALAYNAWALERLIARAKGVERELCTARWENAERARLRLQDNR
jgi:hypothetical protein